MFQFVNLKRVYFNWGDKTHLLTLEKSYPHQFIPLFRKTGSNNILINSPQTPRVSAPDRLITPTPNKYKQ